MKKLMALAALASAVQIAFPIVVRADEALSDEAKALIRYEEKMPAIEKRMAEGFAGRMAVGECVKYDNPSFELCSRKLDWGQLNYSYGRYYYAIVVCRMDYKDKTVEDCAKIVGREYID